MQMSTKNDFQSTVRAYLSFGLTQEEAEECTRLEFKIRADVYKTFKEKGIKVFVKPIKKSTDTRTYKNFIITQDHLGQYFESVRAMCKFYGICESTYKCRRRKGWTVQDSLTFPTRLSKKIFKDHNGKEYKTLSAMCDAYKLPISCFENRRGKGWSLEKTLTTPLVVRTCKDHLGKEFKSKLEMCRFYGITKECFSKRLQYGWNLERALTTPSSQREKKTL